MALIQSVKVLEASTTSIKLEGDFESESWLAHRYSDDHVLLGKEGDEEMAAVGWCDSDVLSAILHGLVERSFSGTIFLRLDKQQKSVVFQNGQLVFARSDLMDDRLGEVIYRAGLISLEQMTDAAVEVTRDRKFGKVLLESGLFTSADLWNALKLQVLEIFQSVFLSNTLHYSIKERHHLPSISVVFEKSTDEIIEDCASFGQMFRSFKDRVGSESKIHMATQTESEELPQPGSFYGDIIELARDKQDVGSFLRSSKLIEVNSYLALFQLLMKRWIDVDDNKIVNDRVTHEGRFERREIKSLIDAYHITLGSARKAFEDLSVSFPIDEITIFLEQKYRKRQTPLFLKSDGSIAAESVRHLYAKCRNSKVQYKLAVWELQSLIQFVLQITGDLLPGQGWAIKKSIQEMLE